MLTRSATYAKSAKMEAWHPWSTLHGSLRQLTAEQAAALAAESELRAGAGKAVLEAQHAAELRQDAAHDLTMSSRGQVSACTLVSHTS